MIVSMVLLILLVIYVLFSCFIISDLNGKLKYYKKNMIKLYEAESRNTEADFDLTVFIHKVHNIQETLDSLRVEMQLLQKRIRS